MSDSSVCPKCGAEIKDKVHFGGDPFPVLDYECGTRRQGDGKTFYHPDSCKVRELERQNAELREQLADSLNNTAAQAEEISKVIIADRDAIRAECERRQNLLSESNARLLTLEAAIVTHRSQKADDRCIEDDDRLYEALGDGIKCDRRVGDKAAMLRNCERFVNQRCEAGGPWKSYAELEAENEMVRAVTEFIQDVCNCCQLLDGWHCDTAWSPWDTSVRKRMGELLKLLYEIKGISPESKPTGPSKELRLQFVLLELAEEWSNKAIASRDEGVRIRQTIKAATDAEANCNVRAEVWDQCADELRKALAALDAKEQA